MDYCTAGTCYLVGGSVAMALGGAVATWAWSRLADRPKCLVWACIVLGSVVLGVGGIAVSAGWNNLGDHSRKVGLLKALARECIIDEAHLLSPPITITDGDKGELVQRHAFYPRFPVVAKEAVLVSDLFDPANDQSERELVVMLLDYDSSAVALNRLVGVLDDCLTPLKSAASERFAVYERLHSSPAFVTFVSSHKRVMAIIKRDYPSLLPGSYLQPETLRGKLHPMPSVR